MERIEQEILGQSRHQIIYSSNEQQKDDLIDKLEDDYPIVVGGFVPMAIRLEDYSLNMDKRNIEQIDYGHLCAINREYFAFQMLYNILKKIKSEIGNNECNLRGEKLLQRVNECFIKEPDNYVKDINELLRALELSCFTYETLWDSYLKNGEKYFNFEELKIPFAIDLSFWLFYLKKMLNNNAYFGIMINADNSLSSVSQRCINDIIGMRINADLSMKLFLDPENPYTYFDTLGNIIQSVHDYGIVDLDDSYSKFTRNRLK